MTFMRKRLMRCAVLGFFLLLILTIAVRTKTNPDQTDTNEGKFLLSQTIAVISGKEEMPSQPTADIFEEEEVLLPAIPAIPDEECFTYEELSDGTLRITGYDESKNTENPYQVIIPAYLDGKPVSTLGEDCLTHNDHLLELTISEGITTLEAYLLDYYSDISLVKIPNSVSSIDKKAFYRKDYDDAYGIAIACSDTSDSYQYALENDFACQIVDPKLPENQCLEPFMEHGIYAYPYYCHYRIEGRMFDYVVVEYKDLEIERLLQGERHYIEWNEFIVLVFYKGSDNICQCIDSSCVDPEHIDFSVLQGVNYRSFLSVEDWNFDGIEDLHCYQGYFGTGAQHYSSLFVYDADSACYVNVPEFLGIDSASRREDKKCIYGYVRVDPSVHCVERYEYLDGKLVLTAELTQTVTSEDAVEILDERIIDGEWQVYHEETFYPRDMSEKEPYLDAYEQAGVLYKNDGYWDL